MRATFSATSYFAVDQNVGLTFTGIASAASIHPPALEIGLEHQSLPVSSGPSKFQSQFRSSPCSSHSSGVGSSWKLCTSIFSRRRAGTCLPAARGNRSRVPAACAVHDLASSKGDDEVTELVSYRGRHVSAALAGLVCEITANDADPCHN